MFSSTPLEFSANILYAFSVYLAARNSVWTWATGLVGCVLFAYLFFGFQLYADVTLQVFFIATSLLGWWRWQHGGQGAQLAIRQSSLRFIGLRGGAAMIIALAYGALLHHFTNAYAPFVDSLILTFSVLAQLLLVQRRIENWYCWFIVNTIAVPLYLSRGLYLTALFYAIYWCNVLYGWYQWRQQLKAESLEYAAA